MWLEKLERRFVGGKQNIFVAHCGVALITTPYENTVALMHEGPSGGGKSELGTPLPLCADGRVLVAKKGAEFIKAPPFQLTTQEVVVDDIGLIEIEDGRQLVTCAEQGYFLRTDGIKDVSDDLPLQQLVRDAAPSRGRYVGYLNYDVTPEAPVLLTWPRPGCANPRASVPKHLIKGIVLEERIPVQVRSLGIRQPPLIHKGAVTYGVVGFAQILPWPIALLWRLVCPRGVDNPSINTTGDGIECEGVGSFEPFLLGSRETQANMLLEQLRACPNILFPLVPNQNIGLWHVGFMPEWLFLREYLGRTGGRVQKEHLVTSDHPYLLGWSLKNVVIENWSIPDDLLSIQKQEGITEHIYAQGVEVLYAAMLAHLRTYRIEQLDPKIQEIIKLFEERAPLEEFLAI